MSLHTYLWRPLGSAGSSQVNAASVCLRAAACCSPARGHTWPSFFLPNPPAYNTAPVLIGRPDATLSKATGCAVYQLTSAYRTKEQLSGCWASASSPSCEFSFRGGERKKKNPPAPLPGRQETQVRYFSSKGTTALLGKYWPSRAEPSRAAGRTGKICEQRHVSHGAGSRSSPAPDSSNAAQHPRTSLRGCARSVSTTEQRGSLWRLEEQVSLWTVSAEPHWTRGCAFFFSVFFGEKNAPRRAVHAAACKFGLKRTAGSLSASGLGRARWSSVQVSVLFVSLSSSSAPYGVIEIIGGRCSIMVSNLVCALCCNIPSPLTRRGVGTCRAANPLFSSLSWLNELDHTLIHTQWIVRRITVLMSTSVEQDVNRTNFGEWYVITWSLMLKKTICKKIESQKKSSVRGLVIKMQQ